MITTNPGPGQIHDVILGGTQELFEHLAEWTTPEYQKKIIQELRGFVGIPKEHVLAFFTSATQCMRMLQRSLKDKKDQVKVLQVTNDAFSESWNSINGDVTRIITP